MEKSFIPRIYHLEDYLSPKKVVLIYGPRQVGKTTILKNFLARTNLRYRLENGENLELQSWLSSRKLSVYKQQLEGYQLFAIDEAQMVPHIGRALKLIVDELDIALIATGSAAFSLAGEVGEPLVGRKRELLLFPLSLLELHQIYNKGEIDAFLESILIYGLYPAVFLEASSQEKQHILREIANAYLFKDILIFERVKNAQFLRKLLSLLAYQIGHEVSLTELANVLEVNIRTVERYLDLLEKSFIIYSVPGFSRNLRKEVTKTKRYYFYDIGIRNAIINNFNPLELRNDVGQLWENFLFSERLKKRTYKNIPANMYFWRTYDKKEIDLVEEREGRLFGYEFKWKKKKVSPPKDWVRAYPEATFEVIDRENYLSFVL